MFILFCDISYHAAGISGSNYSGRNVPVNHTAGTDNAVVTDGNTREDRDIGSNPDMVSNANRFCKFQSLTAL